MSTVTVNFRELTEDYVRKFTQKDISGVAEMLHEDFALEDPVVTRVEGKEKALVTIGDLFKIEQLKFSARNIYVDGSTSIIEFDLYLGDTHLKGTDIIQWEGEKMLELRAYLDIPK
jgi:ketosteroid isomerase-like protein